MRDAVAPVRENELLAKDPPSYFELVTAAAFLLAEREGAQVGVVEAGLGGRLDATNLLSRVACSVVTRSLLSFKNFSNLSSKEDLTSFFCIHSIFSTGRCCFALRFSVFGT